MRRLGLLIIVLLLAACQTGGGGNVVGWVRSPEQVVFRLDVSGNEDPWEYSYGVSPCAVYGDNRVVWTNDLGSAQYEVLYDRVTDEAVSRFIETLTVNERIYTYQSPEITPPPEGIAPIYQTIYIDVNGLVHTANETSGWGQDWYARVTEACTTLSQTPVLFLPTGGWLTVQESEYLSDTPRWTWRDPSVSLVEVAASGQPRWVTGETATQVWAGMTTMPPSLRMEEAGRFFRVALQVPGITRQSPPAPQQQ
jgi:hypothetical protein